MLLAKCITPGSKARVSSNDIGIDEKTAKQLTTAYRGLRIEDLDCFNPTYSCVICSSTTCYYVGTIKASCPEHQVVDENTWASRYDF